MDTAGSDEVVDAFREVMAGVCTPVSVVTGLDGASPHGTTVSAFASLSLEPPMALVALDRGSDLLTLLHTTRRFGINVLGSGQSELALRFARKGGTGKFAGVPWVEHVGVPRIPDARGFLVCTVANLVSGGDHVVVFGDVIAAESGSGSPLTYHERCFGTHSVLDGAVDG